MSPLLAAVDPWRWQPHPEVWFVVAAVIGLGFYATRVIGPKVVPDGQPIVTGRQKLAFTAGVLVLWLASDWPMHDISEEYLYLVHMVQHLLLTLVMPPLFLIAVPEWLGRLLLDGDGPVARAIRQLTRPVPALIIFNAMVAFSHWPKFVNLTIEVGPVHYLAHLALVMAAFAVWSPICGPLPERRLALPAQMLYLFVMSILPTVPSAWLILANGVVYDAYDTSYRLWGVGVVTDQQAAGLIMKLAGGFYLWTIITVIFFTWAGRDDDTDRPRPVTAHTDLAGAGRTVKDARGRADELTWDQVEAELQRLGDASPEGTASGPAGSGPRRS